MQSVRALLAKPLAQKAVRNFGWLVVERIGRLVLGVLVGLVVARYLGPAELGSLTYAIAMVTLLGFSAGTRTGFRPAARAAQGA